MSKETEQEIESNLVEIIETMLKKDYNIGKRLAEVAEKINPREGRGFLYHSAIEALYDFQKDPKKFDNIEDSLQKFKDQLQRKKSFEYVETGDNFPQVGYKLIENYFDKYLSSKKEQKNPNLNEIKFLKSKLSPKNPIELLILTAFNSIEKNEDAGSLIVGYSSEKAKTADNKPIIQYVNAILKGEKSYRLYVICDIDGETHFTITPYE